MPLLTSQQQAIVRLAIARANGPGDPEWGTGGLLAQIALLTGNTEADLSRWDSVGNGDGPLTLDRIQKSGNGFAGWPLGVLVALDGAWRGGAPRNALERMLAAASTAPEDEEAMPSYEGPERRSAFGIWFDLKTVIAIIGFIALVMPVIVFLLRLDVAIRQNTADDARREAETASVNAAQQVQIDATRAVAAKFERAHSIYCSGMRRDSTRAPDADC